MPCLHADRNQLPWRQNANKRNKSAIPVLPSWQQLQKVIPELPLQRKRNDRMPIGGIRPDVGLLQPKHHHLHHHHRNRGGHSDGARHLHLQRQHRADRLGHVLHHPDYDRVVVCLSERCAFVAAAQRPHSHRHQLLLRGLHPGLLPQSWHLLHGAMDRLCHNAHAQQRGLLSHRLESFESDALHRNAGAQHRFWDTYTVH